MGSANAPYVNGLIAQYGLATNYMDSGTHPSLPNYLYMISGDTQYPGIYDVDPTSTWFGPVPPFTLNFPVDKDNLGHQLAAANPSIKWRSYQENSDTPCDLSASADGLYAPKHDPFLYFKNIQNDPNGLCATTNVNYSNFAADLAGGTYRYMWITPNLTNDGHDPSSDPVAALKQTDLWLSTEVPKILASATYQNGGVLFITWDEAEGRNGDSPDQVPMIIVTKGIKSPGMKSAKPYTHASYLRTVEEIFGISTYLGAAANATSMSEFWQ